MIVGARSTLLFILIVGIFLPANGLDSSPSQPIPVKVVVVTMFEVGEDTGDAPGELQLWVERDHLDHVFALPAAYHSVRMNDQGEMAVLTGQGAAHAAATIMALGLDSRFNLSHAYWIVAGIAGANPERASLASAAWARWVVDGNLAYEIDAREIPADWSTGFVPLRKSSPYQAPATPAGGQTFALNSDLAGWAFRLTHATPLPDSEHLKSVRANFDGAAAQRPPFVLLGDELSSSTYWHGSFFDTWANRWLAYYTHDQGQFTTTAMEDTGTLLSLQQLAQAGRVDMRRVMLLRTVSNYDRQPRNLSAAESLAAQHAGTFGAFAPALESAYSVGHVVVSELLGHWTQYEQATPAEKPIKP